MCGRVRTDRERAARSRRNAITFLMHATTAATPCPRAAHNEPSARSYLEYLVTLGDKDGFMHTVCWTVAARTAAAAAVAPIVEQLVKQGLLDKVGSTASP